MIHPIETIGTIMAIILGFIAHAKILVNQGKKDIEDLKKFKEDIQEDFTTARKDIDDTIKAIENLKTQ